MMQALLPRDRALKFYCLLIMAAIIERLLANTWYKLAELLLLWLGTTLRGTELAMQKM